MLLQNLKDENCILSPQSQFGIHYEENGYILFQAQVMELPTVVSSKIRGKVKISIFSIDKNQFTLYNFLWWTCRMIVFELTLKIVFIFSGIFD